MQIKKIGGETEKFGGSSQKAMILSKSLCGPTQCLFLKTFKSTLLPMLLLHVIFSLLKPSVENTLLNNQTIKPVAEIFFSFLLIAPLQIVINSYIGSEQRKFTTKSIQQCNLILNYGCNNGNTVCKKYQKASVLKFANVLQGQLQFQLKLMWFSLFLLHILFDIAIYQDKLQRQKMSSS